MIVRAEVFIERPETDSNEAMFNTLTDLACLVAYLEGDLNYEEAPTLVIKKIRMPDSPKPDVTGYVEFE